MLTPEYLLHVSEGAEEIAAQLHTDIIKRISERVLLRMKRGDDYTLTSIDKWQIETLMDAGYLREDIQKEIAQATGRQQREIAEAFEDAGVRSTSYDNKVYEKADLPPMDLKASPHMIRLMQRNYEATMGEWRNMCRITEGVAQDAFYKVCDTAYNNITAGNLGYIQAFTEALADLAEKGIYSIAYPSGHVDTIETATLRAVRTGVSQASAQIGLARMDEVGCDLVLVSSHMGARPSHQVWQGKIYSRSGESRKYPDFATSTGYGTGAGLCGWNCRHNFSPYIEGMNNPFERYDNEENRELYERTQDQRRMERGIRKTKRKVDVLQNDIDHAENGEEVARLNDLLSNAKAKLKRQSAAYKQFCDENDLRPLPERLKITKMERTAAKASNAVPELKIENVNKQATITLERAYENHRIMNATRSVPLADLPDDHGIIYADYGKMSADSAKVFTDTITSLADEYDTPFTKIRTMTKEEFLYAGNSFAFVNHDYTTDTATLVINPSKCKDISRLSERIKELSENGYCIKLANEYADRYVATHEFAHGIINLQQPLKNKTNWVGANYDVIRQARSELKPIYEEYMSEVGKMTDNAKSLELQSITATDIEEAERIGNLAVEAYDALDAVKLSDYSLADIDEFFAEAFTNEKIGINRNKYGVRVMEVIDKYFRR